LIANGNNEGGSGGQPPKLSRSGKALVYVVVVTLLIALIARTFESSIPTVLTIDGWTLVYILAIFAVALMPFWLPLVQSFTIGKDSVSVTFREVQRLRQEVSVAQAVAEDAATKAEENLQTTLDVEALANAETFGLDPVPEIVKKLADYEGPSGEDPNKGKFGGRAIRNGRELSADIAPIATERGERARVVLSVRSTDAKRPLTDPVIFYLHPTFKRTTVTVIPRRGIARLSVIAWGAFTVGAVTDEGETRLELDLATVPNRPQWFT
jgi:hypothetical protein